MQRLGAGLEGLELRGEGVEVGLVGRGVVGVERGELLGDGLGDVFDAVEAVPDVLVEALDVVVTRVVVVAPVPSSVPELVEGVEESEASSWS